MLSSEGGVLAPELGVASAETGMLAGELAMLFHRLLDVREHARVSRHEADAVALERCPLLTVAVADDADLRVVVRVDDVGAVDGVRKCSGLHHEGEKRNGG